MTDKQKQVPVTKLGAAEIEDVMREGKQDLIQKNAEFLCSLCSSLKCDYCKNALRTGKRRIDNNDTV